MIEFKSVALEDRELLTSFIFSSARQDNNLAFTNLCCWQFLNCSSFAVVEGELVLRFCFPDDRTVYSLPGGEEKGKQVIRLLAAQAKEEQLPLFIYGVFPGMREQLEKIFPEVFEFREERDHFDYLYCREKLVQLEGKEFQTKRNHVNKFRKTYDYRYTPMTAEMVGDCLKMYGRWCEERRCEQENGLVEERQALTWGMKHFRELELTGGVIWVDGEIAAFTYGSPVNRDTFCIHAEKALAGFEGLYNAINQEFARHLPERYVYLNREEDLGLPGLRKAKMSYRPVRLLNKGLAICAQGLWDRLLSSDFEKSGLNR